MGAVFKSNRGAGLCSVPIDSADGYTQSANVEGDPMEHSLDVTSHESSNLQLTNQK